MLELCLMLLVAGILNQSLDTAGYYKQGYSKCYKPYKVIQLGLQQAIEGYTKSQEAIQGYNKLYRVIH